MTWVHRIDGAPGAGKTHTLLDKIEYERDENGVALDNILYLNFTNAGREDSKAAMLDRFEHADKDTVDRMVRTVHSAALRAVADVGRFDYDGDEIIQPDRDGEVYRTFARSRGMNFGGATLYDLEEEEELSGEADRFFAINSWLAETYRKATDARKAPVPFPWRDVSTFRRLQSEWRDFKREHEPDARLWEHHDYVEMAIEENAFPTADVVLIDEFQDLSPLQYKFYKEWRDSGQLERAYIAGDPNQSIYSFRGADPYYFRETDFDEETELNESRRCHGEIAKVGRKVLQAGPDTDTRPFTSRFDGGTVEYINGDTPRLTTAIDAATDDVNDTLLLLTRTNRQWRSVAAFLRERGFPYTVLGKRGRSMWDKTEHMDILTVLRNMPDADKIDGFAGNTLLEAVPRTGERRKTANLSGGTYDGDTLRSAFDDFDTPGDILQATDLKDYAKRAISNALARDGHNNPEQIRVGTVHASKGLEADTVIHFPVYSGRMLEDYSRDRRLAAEEHRVSYVAATRARTRLQVVTDFFEGKYLMPMWQRPDVREVAV